MDLFCRNPFEEMVHYRMCGKYDKKVYDNEPALKNLRFIDGYTLCQFLGFKTDLAEKLYDALKKVVDVV
jgi:hypothetical protein